MTNTAAAQTGAAWEQVAARYDDYVTPTHLAIAHRGLQQIGVRPGMRLLDVAAGSGAVAITAARLGADVLAVDLAPTMLARLRARADAEGLAVQTREMDGHALEVPVTPSTSSPPNTESCCSPTSTEGLPKWFG